MRQHYPLNSQGAEDAGQLPWTDGVPSTGTEGSYFGHALFTDCEAEILAAIDAAGQSRNSKDLAQLAQAIARGVYLGQYSGTANALAAALPNNVVFASLLRGIKFGGFVTATNTGGVTAAITGIGSAAGVTQAPLLSKSGAALVSGDLPVNQDFDIRWDGAAFRMVGSVPSDGSVATTPALAAANVPFGEALKQNTTRAVLSGNQVGVQATAWAGFSFVKARADTALKLIGQFYCYTPSGYAGAAYLSFNFLNQATGQTTTVRQVAVNGTNGTAALNIFNKTISGLPAGTYTISIGMEREDTTAWQTIFLPINSDVSGTISPSVGELQVTEVKSAS